MQQLDLKEKGNQYIQQKKGQNLKINERGVLSWRGGLQKFQNLIIRGAGQLFGTQDYLFESCD